MKYMPIRMGWYSDLPVRNLNPTLPHNAPAVPNFRAEWQLCISTCVQPSPWNNHPPYFPPRRPDWLKTHFLFPWLPSHQGRAGTAPVTVLVIVPCPNVHLPYMVRDLFLCLWTKCLLFAGHTLTNGCNELSWRAKELLEKFFTGSLERVLAPWDIACQRWQSAFLGSVSWSFQIWGEEGIHG